MFPDGTDLAVSAGSRLRLDTAQDSAGRGGAKRIVLATGTLRGEIAPQPAEAPFAFVTSEAEVTVLGTGIAVSRRDDRTRVELLHGRAMVSRGAHRHHLRERGAVIADAAGLRPASWAIRLDFDQSIPAQTYGDLVDRSDGGGRCLRGARHARWAPDHLLVQVPLAADEADAPGWEPGTTVAFALRIEGEPFAPKLQVFNATRRVNLVLRLPLLAPGRWQAIRHDLAALSPVDDGPGWAAGDRIAGVFVIGPSPAADHQLLLDDLALIPPP